jgi:cyclophilin family peptidyl-prolyl cis-trans isomerase
MDHLFPCEFFKAWKLLNVRQRHDLNAAGRSRPLVFYIDNPNDNSSTSVENSRYILRDKDMAKGNSQVSRNKVILNTSMGSIILDLFDDMPITAGNFRKLVEQGFYNGTIFHRIIDDFMIQGGDPTRTGRGGPGYTIRDEFTDHNRNDRGTIAIANAGPHTGGSQFFINLVNNNYLDNAHPVFGKVVEGMDVVGKIGKVKTDAIDRPAKEVRIVDAKIVV